MAYDKNSFLAGLALGRALWRPPYNDNPIYTGLGWTANSRFLVHDKDTILATADQSSRTPYTKSTDGWAICVVCENVCDSQWYGDWVFLYLMSTVNNYSALTVPDGASSVTYDYLGLTWYVRGAGQNAHYGGATSLNTHYPVIHYNGEDIATINRTPLHEDAFLHLMQEAGVRLTS